MVAFTDASMWASSSQLRSPFCHLLLFCEVSSPTMLWDVAWRKMTDYFLYRLKADFPDKVFQINDDMLQQHLLFELEKTLQSSTPSKSLADFRLPMPSSATLAMLQNRLLLEETYYDRESLHAQHSVMVSQLNDEQAVIYNFVVNSEKRKRQILLFVYGHGGTGKTFLWSVILAYFRSHGKIVLAVASSGIASLLLPSGRISHSRFNIPIDLATKTSCDIKKRTLLAELLGQTSMIIWDEAPMSDKRCFIYLDRSLRDILEYDEKLFGGMSILLGGDFHQMLPVSPKSSRADIISLSLPNSYLWAAFKVYKLHKNMRLLSNQTKEMESASSISPSAFAQWLLDVGNGHLGTPDIDDPQGTSWVEIPESLLIPPGENSF